jgi:hypothetical protein
VWLKTDRSLGLTLSLPLARPPPEGPGRFEDHDEQRATPRRRRGRATARWTAPPRWRPPGWASRQGTPRLGCPRSWSCLVKRPRARRCRSSLQAARGLARLSQPAYAATGTATSGRPWTTERITKRGGKSVPKGAIVRKIHLTRPLQEALQQQGALRRGRRQRRRARRARPPGGRSQGAQAPHQRTRLRPWQPNDEPNRRLTPTRRSHPCAATTCSPLPP